MIYRVNISHVNGVYQFNPTSAVVENAAPTHVVITFPSQKELIASNFTIAGFTILSASWSGAVMTLVLSTPVVQSDTLVLVFAPTGQTTSITNNVSSPPAPELVQITTTLTGNFNIDLDGTGTSVITWPDLSTTEVTFTPGTPIRTTKSITPGTVTISNPSVITYFDVYDNNGSTFANSITAFSGQEYMTAIVSMFIGDANVPCLIPSFATSANWTALSGLVVIGCTSLTTLTTHAEWTALIGLEVSGCTSLTTLATHAEWTALIGLVVSGCALTESSVNAILATLNSIPGLTGAYIDLSGGTSAAPTGQGITDYGALTLAGNTVTVNGYPV
jgi:hypothetical protein